MKRAQTRAAQILCLALAFAFSASALSSSLHQNTELFETGKAERLQTPSTSPSEIKIVSYNMRWRSGEDLRRIIELLRTDPEIGGAAIIGLQEADRNRKRSGFTNTPRVIAEELGMYYAWAAPPPPPGSKEREEETGVAILSPYPLTDAQRLVLPHEGPGGRRRAAIGATLRIGSKLIRFYSVHAETRISTDKKLEQLKDVLRDLSNHPKVTSAVVVGDFNTIEGQAIENTTRLFTENGFQTPFPNGMKTWKTFILELKLDWVWLKNLRPYAYGIDKKVKFSDHFPLWVKINLDGTTRGLADLDGRIITINRVAGAAYAGTETVGMLLVDGGGKPGLERAYIRVTASTNIYVKRGETRRQVSFEELRQGDRIEAHFTNETVLMSYPVQATAAEITILK